MGCRCNDEGKRMRSGGEGLNHITSISETFTKLSKQDSEVYIEGTFEGRLLYNFTPAGMNKGTVIRKIIYNTENNTVNVFEYNN